MPDEFSESAGDKPEPSKSTSNEPTTTTTPAPEVVTHADQGNHTFVQNFINEKTYVRVRNKLINMLPDHWTRKIADALEFHAARYPPSRVAEYCAVNGQTFPKVFDIGYYVCENALTDDQLARLRRLTDELSNEELDGMYASFLEGDLVGAAKQGPAALDVEVPDRVWELAGEVSAKLTKEDYQEFMKFLSDPQVVDGLTDFMDTVGKIDPEDMKQLKGAMKKINPENVAEIDGLLSDLGVTMFEFMSNPGLLVKFFRDPVLSKTLTRIRGLLPVFESADLNAMIKMQKLFMANPKAGYVMRAALAIPLTTTGKLTSVDIGPEDFEAMQSLRGIMEDERIMGAMEVSWDKTRGNGSINLRRRQWQKVLGIAYSGMGSTMGMESTIGMGSTMGRGSTMGMGSTMELGSTMGMGLNV